MADDEGVGGQLEWVESESLQRHQCGPDGDRRPVALQETGQTRPRDQGEVKVIPHPITSTLKHETTLHARSYSTKDRGHRINMLRTISK